MQKCMDLGVGEFLEDYIILQKAFLVCCAMHKAHHLEIKFASRGLLMLFCKESSIMI